MLRTMITRSALVLLHTFTSAERAQHKAMGEHLKINGKASPHSLTTSPVAPPSQLAGNLHLLQQAVGMSPLVHEIEHVADVDTDGASQTAVVIDVGRKAVPVSIES